MNSKKRKVSGAQLLGALGAAALLVCGASSVLAGEKPPAAADKVQGMQVAIDPGSGKLRQPTAAEIKALSAALGPMFHRSARSAQVNQLANGTLSFTLGTDSLNIWLAAVNPNGSLAQACFDSSAVAAGAQPVALEDK
jgi:hypothetical protein